MNSDQRFASNIVVKTIQNYLNKQDNLRMIVFGSWKCFVKVIRIIFASKRYVQVLCPTGNSANIISDLTVHSFLKIPTNKKGQEMKPPEVKSYQKLTRS